MGSHEDGLGGDGSVAETIEVRSAPSKPRKGAFKAVAIVGTIALMAAASAWGVVHFTAARASEAIPGVSPSPGGSPSVIASPSPSSDSESVPGPVAGPNDLEPASSVQWDRVGSDWFLLGYDPEAYEPYSGSRLVGTIGPQGSLWLLDPTGESYDLGIIGVDDDFRPLGWAGQTAWISSLNSDGSGEELLAVDLTNRNLTPVRPVNGDPGPVTLAAGGVLVGQVTSGTVFWIDATRDGSTNRIIEGDSAATGLTDHDSAALSLDGTQFAVLYQWEDEEAHLVYQLELVSVDGTSVLIGEPQAREVDYSVVAWLDDSTVLLVGPLGGSAGWSYLALDVTTGESRPSGPQYPESSPPVIGQDSTSGLLRYQSTDPAYVWGGYLRTDFYPTWLEDAWIGQGGPAPAVPSTTSYLMTLGGRGGHYQVVYLGLGGSQLIIKLHDDDGRIVWACAHQRDY